MSLGNEIRILRQKAFYTQEDFAKQLNVALSTVNRWELGKTRPNMKAMRSIKFFCENNGLSYRGFFMPKAVMLVSLHAKIPVGG